ncbi:MAG: hypothetical protein II398_05730 [Prevotella sp.]|nr:hypothetical protein [Prevotella sp.]
MKTMVMCNAEDFQERVEQFLDDILLGVDIENYDDVEVRFLWAPRKFRIGGLADLFVYRGQWYYWTQNPRATNYMTLADFELTGRLSYLEIFGDIKIYPVAFAGFYTGYIDDRGQKIYTGDVVKATMTTNVEIPSTGGRSRAKTFSGKVDDGFTTIVGVNSFADRQDDYYYILDNCPIAMKYTTKVRIIGNVFYDLDRDNPTVSIAERCSMLAFPYGINVRKLHLKMAQAPYYVEV